MIRKSHRAAVVFGAITLLALASCGRVMVGTPIVTARTSEPYAAVPPALRTASAEILYVTDREPAPTERRPVWYGFNRSPSQAYGLCEVRFGDGLTWDELAAQTSTARRTRAIPIGVGRVTELGRLPSVNQTLFYDDQAGVLNEDPQITRERFQKRDDFYRVLGERLALTPKKEVFVFVHGVANSFGDAMFAIAQLWHFAGRQGVPIVYSWPAGAPGLLRGYTRDRESGEFTVFHLKSFLVALGKAPGVEKVHLIGHSRGTDVVITALRELHIAFTAAGLRTRDELRLANLMLAAPDLDAQVMSQRFTAERVNLAARRTTMYVSRYDKAIGLADWLFRSWRRIGQLRFDDIPEASRRTLENIPGFTIIDVTFRSAGHGHSYFYDDPRVASDVILLLGGDRPPGAEHGRPLTKKAEGWWELDEDYLSEESPAAPAPARRRHWTQQ